MKAVATVLDWQPIGWQTFDVNYYLLHGRTEANVYLNNVSKISSLIIMNAWNKLRNKKHTLFCCHERKIEKQNVTN